MLFRLLFTFLLLSFSLTAAEQEKQDTTKVSEAFGHLIGKNMETIGVKLDLDAVIKGLQDSAIGKESPLSETECIEAISAAQQEAREKLANENLAKAENFLKENAQNKDVVVLEEGKLQYKIEKKGSGEKVEPHSAPVIRYVGKYLDGSVFGASQKDEALSLEETIPGFSKGLVGMREGEKRTLYIHPEYGYGTKGYLPPNSLLTFEIEIVKATTPEIKTETLTAEPSKENHTPKVESDSTSVR